MHDELRLGIHRGDAENAEENAEKERTEKDCEAAYIKLGGG